MKASSKKIDKDKSKNYSGSFGWVCCLVAKLCPSLCNPMDLTPPHWVICTLKGLRLCL